MRQQLNRSHLRIGILLASVMATQQCLAQDWSNNGQGYAPMPQAAPASPSSLNKSLVPGPPAQPTVASRPSAWPGAAESEASPWPQPSAAQSAPASEIVPCEGIRILARVGSEAILESEVIGAVNEIIEANKDRIPPDQLETQRQLLIQHQLKGLIETKLIFQDVKRSIPSEGWPQIEKKLAKQFEDVELEKLMKKAGADTPREFDEKLHALGTSLERAKRAFTERVLAQEWVRQQIKRDEEITYDQMVAYYREHQDEFTRPARARWEELTVLCSKHRDKAAAYEAIAGMGNRVFLGGASFAEVAKTGSDGVTAAKGGQRDWTTKGSLACVELDQALFALPVGQLSPIIKSTKGFHIIRVTERTDTAIRPFLDAQVDIRQKIIQQRSQKQLREYMARLEARTPVWKASESEIGRPQLSNRSDPARR